MRVNFVGDIGVFQKYEKIEVNPFDIVTLPEADFHIGNFEFIIHKGRKKSYYDVQKRYSCSYDFFSKLNVDRFSGFGLANNHSMDYGLEGAEDTIKLLEEKNVKVFGFSKDQTFNIGTFEKDGIKLGIIAFVKEGRWSKRNYGFGPDSYDVPAICELISDQKRNFDHLVVFPHWGTELVEIPDHADTVNAKLFIDAGASAVVGHHPHISQGIETYNGGLIAYSLGSFIYIPEEELGYSSDRENRNISICMNLDFDKEGIRSFKPYYYRYDPIQRIPVQYNGELSEKYALYLNSHIYNEKAYADQVRTGLVRREIRSFLIRFKTAPLRTLISYLGLLNISRIKKLTGR